MPITNKIILTLDSPTLTDEMLKSINSGEIAEIHLASAIYRIGYVVDEGYRIILRTWQENGVPTGIPYGYCSYIPVDMLSNKPEPIPSARDGKLKFFVKRIEETPSRELIDSEVTENIDESRVYVPHDTPELNMLNEILRLKTSPMEIGIIVAVSRNGIVCGKGDPVKIIVHHLTVDEIG